MGSWKGETVMLNALTGIIESFSTIGRAIANVFTGLIEMVGLIGQATGFLYGVIDNVIPIPLRVLALAVISTSIVFLIIGRQH